MILNDFAMNWWNYSNKILCYIDVLMNVPDPMFFNQSMFWQISSWSRPSIVFCS